MTWPLRADPHICHKEASTIFNLLSGVQKIKLWKAHDESFVRFENLVNGIDGLHAKNFVDSGNNAVINQRTVWALACTYHW